MVFVYYDTLFANLDGAKVNAAVHAALAPGGSLLVVDHRAPAGAGPESGQAVHRIEEGLLRR
jgi:predicted methyltransferase